MSVNTGEAIIDLLTQYKVDTVFGIPGTHSIELYRGLESSGIKHILPRHEQGAGFMADGYARRSGKPGVCFVITGPGVTNILTAMGEAHSDSVPMLVISPMNDADPNFHNHGRLHEIGDQAAVTRPLTAFSEVANDAAIIPELIHRAFTQFNLHRPMPVHIHIPLSVLRGEVDAYWRAQPIEHALPPAGADIKRIANAFRVATNPVIIAGGGCRFFADDVTALAEQTDSPLITTVAARGVVAEDHPLCVGAQFVAPEVRALVERADFVLLLGTELAEPDHWLPEVSIPENQFWVNLDPQLLRVRATGKALHADVGLAAKALNAELENKKITRAVSAHERCEAVKASHNKHLSDTQKLHMTVVESVLQSMPADCTVCSDMTQIAYTAVEHLPLPIANRWFHPNGYGTLGYAVPAAIGVAFAKPGSAVIALVGDAGFQYSFAEMAVAKEHGLNLVVVLWQNNALQQIADDMINDGISPNAVHQQNPDFLTLATSYGWYSTSVNDLQSIGLALQRCFNQDGPALLEVLAQQL